MKPIGPTGCTSRLLGQSDLDRFDSVENVATCASTCEDSTELLREHLLVPVGRKHKSTVVVRAVPPVYEPKQVAQSVTVLVADGVE